MNLNETFKKHLLKIVSFLFSIILWLYVLNTAEIKTEKSIRIEYKLPEGIAFATLPPTELTYSLRGPRAFLRSLLQTDKVFEIDLTKYYRKGNFQYNLKASNLLVSFPFGVKILGVNPKVLKINLDKKIEKTIPIKLEVLNELSNNKTLDLAHLAPKEVTVYGPKILLKDITEISTQKVDLSTLEGVGIMEVPLARNDERLQYSFQNVKFRYDVRSSYIEMVLEDVPVSFLSTKMILKADRRSVKLVVKASNTMDKNLLRESVRAIAEVPNNASGNVLVQLKANLPDKVDLVEIIPAQIAIKIKK